MFLKADGFSRAGVKHGFFTRRGGVSTGIYGSLNCGYGSADNPDDVTENRHRVAEALAEGRELVTVHQIHSAECVTVGDAWTPDKAPQLDALATDRPGIILGILTADCGPVLFHGEKKDGSPVIGAAHAGWGGALKGVLENTIQSMRALGAEPGTISAALGPCIGPQSYEVSRGFERPFIERDMDAAQFFTPAAKDGHLMFDMPSYIRFRLGVAGIVNVSFTGHDTCAEEADFFSFRRSTLRTEPDYGRQISAICIA